MVAETDSFGNLFEWYKRFCYTFGRSFDRNPNRDIIKLIYQADLEMTPGMFTSLWIGTTILVGFAMVLVAAVLFLPSQSPFSIANPVPFILLFALIGSAAIAYRISLLSAKPDREQKKGYRYPDPVRPCIHVDSCQFRCDTS